MPIQRSAIVAPFSVNSPLLDPAGSDLKKQGKDAPAKPGMVAKTHQLWLQSVANGINGSVQLSDVIPATSASPGQAGTIVPFAGGFYFAVGNNSWLRFNGVPF